MKNHFCKFKLAMLFSIPLFSGYAFGNGTYLQCNDVNGNYLGWVDKDKVGTTAAYTSLMANYGNTPTGGDSSGKIKNVVSDNDSYHDIYIRTDSTSNYNITWDDNFSWNYLIFDDLDSAKKFCQALIDVCAVEHPGAKYVRGKEGAQGPWPISFMYISERDKLHYLNASVCPNIENNNYGDKGGAIPTTISGGTLIEKWKKSPSGWDNSNPRKYYQDLYYLFYQHARGRVTPAQ